MASLSSQIISLNVTESHWSAMPAEILEKVINKIPRHDWRHIGQVDSRTHDIVLNMKRLVTKIRVKDITDIQNNVIFTTSEDYVIQFWEIFVSLVHDFKDSISTIECTKDQLDFMEKTFLVNDSRYLRQLAREIPNIGCFLVTTDDLLHVSKFRIAFIRQVIWRRFTDPCYQQIIPINISDRKFFMRYPELSCRFHLHRVFHVSKILNDPDFMSRIVSVNISDPEDRWQIILPFVKYAQVVIKPGMNISYLSEKVTNLLPNIDKVHITSTYEPYFEIPQIPALMKFGSMTSHIHVTDNYLSAGYVHAMLRTMTKSVPNLKHFSIGKKGKFSIYHIRRKPSRETPIMIHSTNDVMICDIDNLQLVIESCAMSHERIINQLPELQFRHLTKKEQESLPII